MVSAEVIRADAQDGDARGMAERELAVAKSVQEMLRAVAADAERARLAEGEPPLELVAARGELVVRLPELRPAHRLRDGVAEKQRAAARAAGGARLARLARERLVQGAPRVHARLGERRVRARVLARARRGTRRGVRREPGGGRHGGARRVECEPRRVECEPRRVVSLFPVFERAGADSSLVRRAGIFAPARFYEARRIYRPEQTTLETLVGRSSRVSVPRFLPPPIAAALRLTRRPPRYPARRRRPTPSPPPRARIS